MRRPGPALLLASIVPLFTLLACGNATDAGTSSAPTVELRIGEVQGRGDDGSMAGREVRIRGIVSGDFQDHDDDAGRDLGGFFLLGAPDDDAATSDGVFVFDARMTTPVDVDAGDVVLVRGTVNEHFGETQVVATAIEIAGDDTAVPARFELPAAATTLNSDGEAIAELEHYEGMLVEIGGPLTISEVRNVDRFGELLLSAGGRLWQYTNGNSPDADGYRRHRDDNARRSLLLDDGRRAENPQPVPYLEVNGIPLRAGNRVDTLTGVLRYARGSGGSGFEGWRLMPTAPVTMQPANPRSPAPSRDGNLVIASFNVLNFFSTVNDGTPVCGPAGNEPCRGADSGPEQRRQLQKIAAAVTLLDADVVGLVELENDASASLQLITAAVNERAGAGEFDYVATGSIGRDTIKTGFIYRPARVSAVGEHALLDSEVDARFDDERNRPALAQTFELAANAARLTVIVNHLKSKGSDCVEDGDPNTGDGQGNCNLTRTRAAAALADWAATDPTGSGDPDVLVLGDLNAYPREDPIAALSAAGLVNLLDAGDGIPWSFTFDGQAGALDHAFATPSLAPQVIDAGEWHINADEPPVLDYNLDRGRDPTLFDGGTPWRASDHDPVVVDLELRP